jgi:hypothetical protein
VVKHPHNMKRAKICMTCFSHGVAEEPGGAPRVTKRPNAHWAIMAPTLPEAAEIPCDVERYRVGKHSPGTMKVVAFGPKLKKN